MKKNNVKWLIVNDNIIRYEKEVYGFTEYDFLFSNWRIKGKNPIIIEGDAVVDVEHKMFSLNKVITERKRVKIYNPIIEELLNAKKKEGKK